MTKRGAARHSQLGSLCLVVLLMGSAACHDKTLVSRVCYANGVCVNPDGSQTDPNGNLINPVTSTTTGSTTGTTVVDNVDPNQWLPQVTLPTCNCPISANDLDGDCVPNANEMGASHHEGDPNNVDSDGDGIRDGCEDKNHDGHFDPDETDPSAVDTDADGLGDGVEDQNQNGYRETYETSPILADSDHDGIADGQEDLNHNGKVDAWTDTNGDGCFDPAVDVAGESDPRQLDTDNDQIPDGKEDKNHNGVFDPNVALHETVAFHTDTDCDKLTDGKEDLNHDGAFNPDETNPRLTDTDSDGIPDGIEDANLNGKWDFPAETDPRQGDSDGDGIFDGTEDRNHNGKVDAWVDTNGNGCFDYLADQAGESDPRLVDTDQDGIADAAEDKNQDGLCAVGPIRNPLNPNRIIAGFSETCAFLLDTDCDGLGDAQEDKNKNGNRDVGETDPRIQDTDNDQLSDGCPTGHTLAGCEDKNNNGVVDAGETDPTNVDTDGDQLPDGCEVNFAPNPPTGGTNPLVIDTDADGYADGDEDANKNCVHDAGETDPRLYDAPPVSSSQAYPQWSVCAPENLNSLTFAESARLTHDFRLAFEVEKTNTQACPSGLSSACPGGQNCINGECVLEASYLVQPYGKDLDNNGFSANDTNDMLYGFVFESPRGIQVDTTTNVLLSRDVYGFVQVAENANNLDDILDGVRNSLVSRYTAGGATVLEVGNLPSRPAYDSLPADAGNHLPGFMINVAQRQVSLAFTGPGTALSLRNDILVNQFLAGQAPDPVGVPPTSDPVWGNIPACNLGAPHCYTNFRLNIGAVQRLQQQGPTGQPVVVVTVALTPDDSNPVTANDPLNRYFADRLTRLEDLTGGASVARFGATVGKACDNRNQALAKADMLWVVDDSRSMQQIISRLQQAATAAEAVLKSNAGIVDFRVGLTTTNPSAAARAQCPSYCSSQCGGSQCSVSQNGCADTTLGCIKACPASCAYQSTSCTDSCTCLSCSGNDMASPTPHNDVCGTCDNADPTNMASVIANDASTYHLPGGGGTFYYEDTYYMDCNAGDGNPFLDWCNNVPYNTANLLQFYGSGGSNKRLTGNAGLLHAAPLGATACKTAPLDLYYNTSLSGTSACSDKTAFPCCDRVTDTCADGPTVLASQMCDLIRAMGGVPGTQSNGFASSSARRHSAPEEGSRSARRLLESLLPAWPADMSDPTDAHFNPASVNHLRLSCRSTDVGCTTCDPRTSTSCPVIPLATIFLSDEEDFYFKDDCAMAQTYGDKQQLPSSCYYVDGDPNTQEACTLAYCQKFPDSVTGTNHDQTAWTADGFYSLEWGNSAAGFAPECSPAGNPNTCIGDPCPTLTQAQCGCAPGDSSCSSNNPVYPFCYWNTPAAEDCLSDADCAVPAGSLCRQNKCYASIACNNSTPCQSGTTCNTSHVCVDAQQTPVAGTPLSTREPGCMNRCAVHIANPANTTGQATAQVNACEADPFCRWDASQVTTGSQSPYFSPPGPCVMKTPINDCQACKRLLRTQESIQGTAGVHPLIGFGSVGPVYAIVRNKGAPGLGLYSGATVDSCQGSSVTWGRGDGQAYRDLAGNTLGRTQDVCAPDYQSFMQVVTADIATLSRPYILSGSPIPATLKVGIARQNSDQTYTYIPVPRSRTQGFIYDPTGNSIGFKSDPVDGECAPTDSCTANNIIEGSEIAWARSLPTVPKTGDIIYISYHLWEPLGQCPTGQTEVRTACAAEASNNACTNSGDCAPGYTCSAGACAINCTPGRIINACVTLATCGACEDFNSTTRACEATAACCNATGQQSCNPSASNTCPVGMACDETCVCNQIATCPSSQASFYPDGTVSNCPGAVNCCNSFTAAANQCASHLTAAACNGDTAQGQPNCKWPGTCLDASNQPNAPCGSLLKEHCSANTSCHWQDAASGTCAYRYQTCCPTGNQVQCYQDPETAVSTLYCAANSCTCNCATGQDCDIAAGCVCYVNGN